MRGCALGALLKELNDSEWIDASPASGQFITFRFHYNPLKVFSGLVAHLRLITALLTVLISITPLNNANQGGSSLLHESLRLLKTIIKLNIGK